MINRRHWMDSREFEDANAACGLLPGPASTQLAMFCAYRVAGPLGATVGGLGFIAPAVILILALSVLFFGPTPPPLWVRGAGAGAGAAVAAVALQAARGLIGPSFARVRHARWRTVRWVAYLATGTAAAALTGSFLVLALLACGTVELVVAHPPRLGGRGLSIGVLLLLGSPAAGSGRWPKIKVGALSFGGGFVIIPLMQGDAVHVYHWMTNSEFLNAVALGQITPGPVVATVAAVGYAAHGIGGGLLAAVVAFTPSFAFVLLGGRHFTALRGNQRARAFLDGAGPAAIGAIIGAAITPPHHEPRRAVAVWSPGRRRALVAGLHPRGRADALGVGPGRGRRSSPESPCRSSRPGPPRGQSLAPSMIGWLSFLHRVPGRILDQDLASPPSRR